MLTPALGRASAVSTDYRRSSRGSGHVVCTCRCVVSAFELRDRADGTQTDKRNRRCATTVIDAHPLVVGEMAIDQDDNDKRGAAGTDRIAGQPQDAGDAAAPRALAARRRGEAARERIAGLREWGGHSPCRSREAANRAANTATAAQVAGKQASEASKRAATAHEDAATAHDRAADAAECEGDLTHAIEHRRAAARDRTAAPNDLSHNQQTTATRSGYGAVCDAGQRTAW